MAIKLSRLTSETVEKGTYKITLPGPINADLKNYIAAYREHYEDEITPETIIQAIVKEYLAADASFQQWKKNRSGKSPAMPANKPAQLPGAGGTTAATDTGSNE